MQTTTKFGLPILLITIHNTMSSRNKSTKHIINLLFFSELHSAKFILFMAEIIWALALFWPGETFERPVYSIMAKIAQENIWASVFLVTGFIQLYLLLSQNYFSKFAQCFAAWNAIFWTLIVIAMYNSVMPPPASISGETSLAIAAAWVFVRSGYKTRG